MQRASFQFDGGGRKSKKVMMKRGKEGSEGQNILRANATRRHRGDDKTHDAVWCEKRRTRTKAEDVPHNGLKLPITLDFLTSVASFRGKIAHCDVTICGVTFHLG